ncbi:DNA double-strand break repair Rad50 ATPase [uncultured archaeon]|nr:DNA double-strand break repair Rad50 ATPase [uncultured archaeon]
MKIKKIVLHNIRSYEHQEVDFPEGSTLLSGDIGSGKTSILLGIEFALFGLQPGQRGTGLLRNSEDEGYVIIEFEVDGIDVKVERTLRRKKTISQEACFITVDRETRELSVTESKNFILEILNYPKEFAKKQNLLYRYTVYTPQEEMKQIILEDPEIRLDTLRHVFGIDKYKTILENTALVLSKIREERRVKEGMIFNLEQDRSSVFSKEIELETKKGNSILLEKERFLKTENRKKIQSEKEEISKKKEEKNKIQQEIEKSKLMILTKNETITSNIKTISQLQVQIKELRDMSVDETRVSQLEQELNIMKRDRNFLAERNIYLSSEINSLNSKNQDNENTKNKISRIDMCPTCLQDVGPVHKGNIVNKFDSETAENRKKVDLLTTEKKGLSEKIIDLDRNIVLKEKQLKELTILKIRSQDIPEKERRLSDLEKMNQSISKDVELLKQHLEILNNMVFELSRFDSLFDSKQKELDDALRQERAAEIKLAEIRKEIELYTRQIEELNNRIKKTEEIKEQLNYLIELENWLSKNFVPFISFTEKNVMIKLKSEFSQLFSEWFGMLVSDSFNVRLSDDFTPIIEQQDYELDYSYLSGGERTAVALAYRLALNQVINSILSRIKTKDLVILDEPTDGFSEQQLDKMRSVLEELNIAQLIIVSHEQKIEGFVDNVIKFKKMNGISERG